MLVADVCAGERGPPSENISPDSWIQCKLEQSTQHSERFSVLFELHHFELHPHRREFLKGWERDKDFENKRQTLLVADVGFWLERIMFGSGDIAQSRMFGGKWDIRGAWSWIEFHMEIIGAWSLRVSHWRSGPCEEQWLWWLQSCWGYRLDQVDFVSKELRIRLERLVSMNAE